MIDLRFEINLYDVSVTVELYGRKEINNEGTDYAEDNYYIDEDNDHFRIYDENFEEITDNRDKIDEIVEKLKKNIERYNKNKESVKRDYDKMIKSEAIICMLEHRYPEEYQQLLKQAEDNKDISIEDALDNILKRALS